MLPLGRFGLNFDDRATDFSDAAERVAVTMDGVAAGRRDAAATFSFLAARTPEDRERLLGVAAELMRSAERAETFAAAERSMVRPRWPKLS